MKKILVGCTIALASQSANALRYEVLLKNEAEHDIAWTIDKAYIRGVGEGSVIANGMMQRTGKPMYCQPKDLVLDEVSYIHLIKKTGERPDCRS